MITISEKQLLAIELLVLDTNTKIIANVLATDYPHIYDQEKMMPLIKKAIRLATCKYGITRSGALSQFAILYIGHAHQLEHPDEKMLRIINWPGREEQVRVAQLSTFLSTQ